MFSKIRGTFIGGPNNKDCRIWSSYWGSPIWGNYHLGIGIKGLSLKVLSWGFRAWRVWHRDLRSTGLGVLPSGLEIYIVHAFRRDWVSRTWRLRVQVFGA